MALLPGLPVLIKAASIIKNAKVLTSWGSLIASRVTSERASWWQQQVRRLSYGTAGATAVGSATVYATSQEEIAVSGRQRLLLTTREEEMAYADEASAEIRSAVQDKLLLVRDLDGQPPPPIKRGFFFGPPAAEARNHVLLDVAQRLIRAVRGSIDLPAGVEKLRWRLHLVDDDDTMNAFVLPNGHIYVFTGVLRATPSSDVLAFLLGHECAHAVLRHGGEELSQAPLFELAGLLVTSALVSVLPLADAGYTAFQSLLLRIGLTAVEAPAQLLHLSYSRDHESEADEVGILLASRACFDPYHAQYLFHNFAEAKRAAGLEEGHSAIGSTHPLDKDREDAVRRQLRKAMDERTACHCAPVDFQMRRKLDKQLNREHLRRMSCSSRCENRGKDKHAPHAHSH